MAYTDMTTTFVSRREITTQDLTKLINNDIDIHIASGTVMCFYQAAAPANWTKLATQNDKMLRAVSGGTGGSAGGTTGLSTGFSIAHTHTANSHTHSFPTHQHLLEYETPSFSNRSKLIISSDSDGAGLLVAEGTPATARKFSNLTETSGSHTSGSTAPSTDSQLSDIAFAYADVIICSKDAGSYSDMTGEFVDEDLGTYQLFTQMADNDDNDRWATGTVAIFVQASVPSKWTQVTTVNDKLLRVVSGSGGSTGGSQSPSSAVTLAHSHTVDGHTHTTQNHQHQISNATDTLGLTGSTDTVRSDTGNGGLLRTNASGGSSDGREIKNQTGSNGSGYASSSSDPGTDSQLSNITLAYYDCIFAQKAALNYTDLTTEFTYKKLMAWTDFDELAENDADNRLVASTLAVFFQSTAPTNWTKDTSQNDKALRVVSGTGGGTGGSQSPSAAITLNHSHTVNAHTHNLGNHQHVLDYSSISDFTTSGAAYVVSSDFDGDLIGESGGSAATVRRHYNETDEDGGGGASGNASDTGTDSQLTNTTFAYIDIIVCSKD